MFDLNNIFKYHAPTPETLKAYTAIREAAKAFAVVLIDNTPEGADQAAALRHIREASMTANAAVALGGRLTPTVYELPKQVEPADSSQDLRIYLRRERLTRINAVLGRDSADPSYGIGESLYTCNATFGDRLMVLEALNDETPLVKVTLYRNGRLVGHAAHMWQPLDRVWRARDEDQIFALKIQRSIE